MITRASPSASPAGLAVEILVEAGDWQAPRSLRTLAQGAIAAALKATGRRLIAPAEVAVVFSDDRHVRALNRRFRSKDKSTNVLSFPAAAPLSGAYGPLLGDIVLGHETVKAEADDQGIPLADHLRHLIVHGFLHLLGYDHSVEKEAVAMERLETFILNGLGVPNPYAEPRSPPPRR